jgi:uncharacterized protein (TIGR02147 family)
MKEVNLFEYLDFRLYMRDYYLMRKHLNPHYSYQYITQKYNLGSRSHFYDVLHGRVLTAKYLAKYLLIFEFNSEREKEYFSALVHYNQSSSREDQEKAFATMVRSSEKLRTMSLDGQSISLFSHWYLPIIYQAMEIYSGQSSLDEIYSGCSVHISENEFLTGVQLLKENNWISYQENAGWQLRHHHLRLDKRDNNIFLQNYHYSLLEEGRKHYLNKEEGQNLLSVSVGIEKEQLGEVQKILKEAQQKISLLSRKNDKGEELWQVNIQLFQLWQK